MSEDHASLNTDSGDDPVTRAIIGAAIQVHRFLGPGLLESAYQACLAHELRKRGHHVERELSLPVEYDGVRLNCGYRLDLVVDDQVVVEIKCVDAISSIHEAQLLTYLRLSGKTRGLLINFNVALLKNGILRRVMNYRDSSAQSSHSASAAPLR